MKERLILFLSVIFIAVSSNGKSIESINENQWRFDSLSVSKKVYIQNDTAREGMLIDLSLVYPVSVPEGLNLQKVQNTFASVFLGIDDFKGTAQVAFDETLATSILDAEGLAESFEDRGGESTGFSYYELFRHSTIGFESANLITVTYADYSYTGGAHGIYSTVYYNIDKRNGELITEEQLFIPDYKDKLAQLIQDEIERRNVSLIEEDMIGLYVSLEDVKPNKNFYFTDQGLVYAYNIYEITPYVQGIVEVVIPYDKVMPLIDNQYLTIIDGMK